MSGVADVAAAVLGAPMAVWLGHKRRFGVDRDQRVQHRPRPPSFAILVLGTQLFGLLEYPVIGSFTTFVALVALAIPPIVTNAYIGMAEVPDEIREAARGMGMTRPAGAADGSSFRLPSPS